MTNSWQLRHTPREALTPRQSGVLDALVDLFLAQGFRDLGLDDMAAHVRCSKSTLYSLAGSKEQLVARCVEHFFRRAAEHVEARVAAEPSPVGRVREYLLAVAAELDAASDVFLDDVADNPATRHSYERHTQIAANRVRDLVGAASELDPVRSRFLGELAAATMDAIERGGVTQRTGLSHAEAYAELATVVLAAADAAPPRPTRPAARRLRSAR